MRAHIRPHNLQGRVSVPGSKSHTIRAVVISTMSEGRSIIRNPLPSADCLSSMRACAAYGARTEIGERAWTVEGVGRHLHVPEDVVDAGNSGTTLYFVTAMATLIGEWSVLTGDWQIRRRPIVPLLRALQELDATAFTTRSHVDAPPVVVRGPMRPGTAHLSGKLSQYVSAILLAAPNVDGTVRVEVEQAREKPYLQMTVDWMTRQGIHVEYDRDRYRYFEVRGPQAYRPVDATIPSDWESVAFPLVAAAVTDSEVTIEDLDVGGNQGDAVIVDILKEMGADVQLDEDGRRLTITGGRKLRGITVDCSDIPDAVPILSVAGCFAEGVTRLTGVEGVRVKETDRVAVMREELGKMGARIEDDESTMTIYGGRPLTGATVDSHDDHRVAMSLAVAGLFARGETVLTRAECVSVSFPNFFALMNQLGAGFVTEA